MLAEITQWIVQSIGNMGYLGIIFMMFLESSFFPFPSEVVMIPAGYLASKGEMNIFLILLFGITGSILGALFNYYLALKIGRKTLLKFGHYFFISKEAIEKVEDFFLAHGKISTFTGRLIPGIRQLISLPAGVAKMDIKIFIFYTSLGAGIWATILTLLGYFIGENETLLMKYLHIITIIVIALIIVGIIIYSRKNYKNISK